MTFNEANTVEQMVLDACITIGWTYAARPALSRQVYRATRFETVEWSGDMLLPRKVVG